MKLTVYKPLYQEPLKEVQKEVLIKAFNKKPVSRIYNFDKKLLKKGKNHKIYGGMVESDDDNDNRYASVSVVPRRTRDEELSQELLDMVEEEQKKEAEEAEEEQKKEKITLKRANQIKNIKSLKDTEPELFKSIKATALWELGPRIVDKDRSKIYISGEERKRDEEKIKREAFTAFKEQNIKEDKSLELLKIFTDYVKYNRVVKKKGGDKTKQNLEKALQLYNDAKSEKLTSENDHKTFLWAVYRNIINYGLGIINSNKNIDTTEIYNKLEEYTSEYNSLAKRGDDHIIVQGGDGNYIFKQYEKGDIDKFKTYLQPTVAEIMIKEYWEPSIDRVFVKKEPVVLVRSNDNDPQTNDMIDAINTAVIFDTSLNPESEELVRAKNFSNTFSSKDNNFNNKANSIAYIKSIKDNKGEPVYKTDEAVEKAYLMPGKFFEYDQSGPNNINKSRALFHSNEVVEVTDQRINNIFQDIQKKTSKIGLQFCIDNLSIEGKFFSEAKYYSAINYVKWYNINIKLKEMYHNDLKEETFNIIRDLQINRAFLKLKKNTEARKEELEKQKVVLESELKKYKEILTEKRKFNLDFYKNRQYMGIGISMNKFNPIVYSEEFLESELYKNNKKDYDRAIELQKQKFAPLMTNKKITRIIYKEGDGSVQDRFNKEFNSQIGLSSETPFNYFFSVAFSNVKTIYDYSNDPNIISSDNALEFYALVHSFDEKSKNHKKAAGIPIEMFKVIDPEPEIYSTNPEAIPKTEEPKTKKTKKPEKTEEETKTPEKTKTSEEPIIDDEELISTEYDLEDNKIQTFKNKKGKIIIYKTDKKGVRNKVKRITKLNK